MTILSLGEETQLVSNGRHTDQDTRTLRISIS
jgi:hypothetical protein